MQNSNRLLSYVLSQAYVWRLSYSFQLLDIIYFNLDKYEY